MKRVGLTKKDCRNDTIQNLHIEQKKLDRLRKKKCYIQSKAKWDGTFSRFFAYCAIINQVVSTIYIHIHCIRPKRKKGFYVITIYVRPKTQKMHDFALG